MSSGDDDQEEQERELAKLRAELASLEASFPAYSIKPSLMLKIEDIEEQIERIERQVHGK